MALESYDRGALFIDGVCQGEWQDGSVDFLGSFSAVETMANGGSIRGFVRDEARGMNVTATYRIRTDGTEFDEIVDAYDNGTTVACHVWIGGKQFGAEGKINLGSAALKEGTIEMNFVGAKPEIF